MKLRPALLRSTVLLIGLLALAGCEKVPPKAPATAATPATAPAQDALRPGVDYAEIPNGAPFEPQAGTVEVVEVFGYTCPHCAHFEPQLGAWAARQPADVRVLPVPAPFGNYWTPFAKAFYAAEEAGVLGKSHAAVFRALHEENALPTPPATATNAQVAQFYARFGVDAADFERRMDSASVAAKLQRAEAFIARSGVDATPTLVVNGRYRVLGQSFEDMLRIADALVARERAAR
ncbi:MAG TPA: thiol:disulfide interchange protein DsbA/DsbL [Lysobacter sp.]|nr:thiol:disulfide interchange protein DsbA/DsbL [Lysobacter sp.]